MGTRYVVTVMCPNCGRIHNDVYYAPTCGFLWHKCDCGTKINLSKWTGISYEDASNLERIERIVASYKDDGMRFEVFIEVANDWNNWLSLGHWTIDCSIAACNPFDLANSFLYCVADALNTRAKWTQGSNSNIVHPLREKAND